MWDPSNQKFALKFPARFLCLQKWKIEKSFKTVYLGHIREGKFCFTGSEASRSCSFKVFLEVGVWSRTRKFLKKVKDRSRKTCACASFSLFFSLFWLELNERVSYLIKCVYRILFVVRSGKTSLQSLDLLRWQRRNGQEPLEIMCDFNIRFIH